MKSYFQLKILLLILSSAANLFPMMSAARSGARAARVARPAAVAIRAGHELPRRELSRPATVTGNKPVTTSLAAPLQKPVLPAAANLQSNWAANAWQSVARRFKSTASPQYPGKVLSPEEVKKSTAWGVKDSVLDGPDGPDIARQTLEHYFNEGTLHELSHGNENLLKALPKEEANTFAKRILEDYLDRKEIHKFGPWLDRVFLKLKAKERGELGYKILAHYLLEARLDQLSNWDYEFLMHSIPQDLKEHLAKQMTASLFRVYTDRLPKFFAVNGGDYKHYKPSILHIIDALPQEEKIEAIKSLTDVFLDDASFISDEAFKKVLELLPEAEVQALSREAIQKVVGNKDKLLTNSYDLKLFLDRLPANEQNDLRQEILTSLIYEIPEADRVASVRSVNDILLHLEKSNAAYLCKKILHDALSKGQLHNVNGEVVATFLAFYSNMDRLGAQKFCKEALEKYLADSKLDDLRDFSSLFNYLAYEDKVTLSNKIVEKKASPNSRNFSERVAGNFLLKHNQIQNSVDEYLKKCKESGQGVDSSATLLSVTFGAESYEEKDYFGKQILDWSLAEDAPGPRINLYAYLEQLGLPEEEHQGYIEKMKGVANFEEVLDRGLDSPTASHVQAHTDAALGVIGTALHKGSPLAGVVADAHDYSAEEFKKGRFTLFHGQGWAWTLPERIKRRMWELSLNKDLGDEFRCLRFKKGDIFTDEAAHKVVQHGVTDFATERKPLLFTTPSLGASRQGSSPVGYIAANTDQSLLQNRNPIDLVSIFEDFEGGHGEAFRSVSKKNPQLIEDISRLHRELYDFGNLLTISADADTADTMAYPTWSRGPLRPLALEGGGEVTKMSEIMEGRDRWPFAIEIGVPIDKRIYDPREAEAAGIAIREWNRAKTGHLESLIDDLIKMVMAEKCAMEAAGAND